MLRDLSFVLVVSIGMFLVIYLLHYVDKKIRVKTIVFSPVLITLMIGIMNKVGSNTMVEIFGEGIEFVIFLYSFIVFIFYILFLFEKLAQSPENNDTTSVVLRIGTMILSCCIYFALIYLMLYRLSGQHSFSGGIGEDFISQFISFIYFSIVTFMTVGFGDISPVTSITKLIVIFQIIMGYITMIFTIYSFAVLKERSKIKLPSTIENRKIDEVEKKRDFT